MQKTIIVYSSVDGHTKEICQKIASQLEHQVDIVSVDDNPMIEDYDRIIIGASIRYGKYRESLFDFIDKNKNTIDTKKNAFFSVNVVARKKEKNKPETNPTPKLTSKITHKFKCTCAIGKKKSIDLNILS